MAETIVRGSSDATPSEYGMDSLSIVDKSILVSEACSLISKISASFF